jgi:predicted aminopeptidase
VRHVHNAETYGMVPGVLFLRSRFRLAVLLLAVVLASCRTTRFYMQAAHGQWEVLSKARPIASVRKDPETSAELRRKLELVEQLRAFAHDTLKLPTDKQFHDYADLGRKYVVWNVVAAPEFSLEAKTWSYPFLGKLKYRGFFTEKAAREEAAGLKAQGFDTAVGGVRVYSTLGFFPDPVLNTFIQSDQAELAETLFHELTHARLYLSGDTDFNEAYATASAQLGVRAWLLAKGDRQALARYDKSLEQSSRLLAMLKETRGELEALYGRRDTLGDDEVRREKAHIFDRAQSRYLAVKAQTLPNGVHSKWTGENLNNARLAAVAAYHDLVPAFTQVFQDRGGDWEAFHQAVAAMKPLSKEERRQRLDHRGWTDPP